MVFKNNGNKRTFTTSKKLAPEQLTNEIAQMAYQYYVDRGYQSGNEMDDWLRAEKAIKAKYNLK